MDIGVYISELLAANGELSVPGLGYLVLQKIPGYYNENDGKFYPPRSEVRFDPQQIDDDETLTQYIAGQKNISLSSAKYFAEKYIASIREDALVREVHVGDAGSFVADQGRLIFIPGQKSIANPAFFGLSPVNLPKTLPSPAPIVTPPPAPEPERPSYSNFTSPQTPPSQDYNRPAEPQERQNIYRGSTPYPPPLDNTPPPVTPPPPATPNRDRQALIDAFNASNKGAYTEQGASPFQNTRPDLYPPMTSTPKATTGQVHEEEEEQKRPIALFILIGLIVLLVGGVFALKKFMPARYEAIKGVFSHKKATDDVADIKTGDTVKIKEPAAVIPPPRLDSAAQAALNEQHKKDSIRNIAVTDSLKKQHRLDSIADRKQRIIDAKKRHDDSLVTVKTNKEIERKRKADSTTQARAAAAAEKKLAKQNKALGAAQVTPAPKTVVVPVPDKNTKVAAPGVQKTVTTVPVSTGDLTFAPVDPTKTWYAAIGPFPASVVSSKIAGLKKIGIESFAVKKGTQIFVAMGAYAKNSEADAAATKFKQSGVPEAYLIQINK